MSKSLVTRNSFFILCTLFTVNINAILHEMTFWSDSKLWDVKNVIKPCCRILLFSLLLQRQFQSFDYREEENKKMKLFYHRLLMDNIVSNLISNRKLTANDECTILILQIYFSAPGSLTPGVCLLAIIATALTKWEEHKLGVYGNTSVCSVCVCVSACREAHKPWNACLSEVHKCLCGCSHGVQVCLQVLLGQVCSQQAAEPS